jgi:hypothetical protein
MSSESDYDNSDNKEFAKLSELDRTGDKAPYLGTLRETGVDKITIAGTGGIYPSDVHDLQKQEKEEERKSSLLGSQSIHNDKPRFYASLILSIFTLGLAAFSILSWYQMSILGTLVFPSTPAAFAILFVVSGLLAVLFVYTTISSGLEIRMHRHLKKQNT